MSSADAEAVRGWALRDNPVGRRIVEEVVNNKEETRRLEKNMIEYSDGTVYWDLVEAEARVRLARHYGVVDWIDYHPAIAVEYVDRALEALQSARARLTGGAS